MTLALTLIEDVRKQIAADDDVLAEARRRRSTSLGTAASYPGVRRTYYSGSVAMGVANDPLEDADGGMVLDRRVYPSLGPDGGGESPTDIVAKLHDHIGPGVRQTWAKATVHDMKRGLSVYMHEPVLGDQDPYVDIVVALERRNGKGLWIPNLTRGTWDPSDPEEHVRLMLAGSRSLRRTRAQVVRLAKAWNKQFSEPAFNSFNLVALALECITEPEPLDHALLRFFEYSVASVADHLTEDPAGVSGPIKLELTKSVAVSRLTQAHTHLKKAMATRTLEEAAACMHEVFWVYLPEGSLATKADLAALLRTGTPRIRTTAAGLAVAGAVTTKRSFGGPRA